MKAEEKPKFAVTTTVPGFLSHAEIIGGLIAKYEGAAYSTANATELAKTTFARKELRDARIALDKAKSVVKAEALAFCAKVEDEYKSIRATIQKYEDIPDAVIKAEEARKEAVKQEKARLEAERISGIRAKIGGFNAFVTMAAAYDSEALTIHIAKIEAGYLAPADYAELLAEAHDAKNAVLKTLRDQLATLQEKERKDAAELAERERIKAEQEAESKRLEALRVENEKAATIERDRLAKEKEEQDRLQAIRDEEFRKERAELDRLRNEDAERRRIADEKAAAEKAESDRLAAIAQKKLDNERAELERKQREIAEAKRKEDEAAAEVKRKAEAAELEKKRKSDLAAAEKAHNEKMNAATADHVTTLRSILSAATDQTLSAPAALQLIAELAQRGIVKGGKA